MADPHLCLILPRSRDGARDDVSQLETVSRTATNSPHQSHDRMDGWPLQVDRDECRGGAGRPAGPMSVARSPGEPTVTRQGLDASGFSASLNLTDRQHGTI